MRIIKLSVSGFYCFSLIILLFCFPLKAIAQQGRLPIAVSLSDRVNNFPSWEKLPSPRAEGDLFYPDWMEGDWQVTSTLVDLAAPLAPDIVTPGFEGNRQYLNQPVSFPVKFVKASGELAAKNRKKAFLPLSVKGFNKSTNVVADRAFNGLSLARAYLGDRSVISVKTDPENPNRQITLLKGDGPLGTRVDRQLVSVVSSRATETTSDGRYITTEIFQQLFKSGTNPYFNSVESTTAYRKLNTNPNPNPYISQKNISKLDISKPDIPTTDTLKPIIEADQITAVFLSPQDPNYFKTGDSPVALYKYHLEFFK
jgi:hypothetical protein